MIKKLSSFFLRGFSSTNPYFRQRDFQSINNPVWNPPKRIFLIRHAEHEGNADETLFYSFPDHSMKLTDLGREQSIELSQSIYDYINENNDSEEETLKWYISPYTRCIETFELLSLPFGGPEKQDVIEEPRLREQEWGNLQDPSWTIRIRERNELGRFYYRFPNGESGADVYDRVSSFIDTTFFREFQNLDCADNIILVSHGITLRMFLTRYYRWTMEQFQTLWNFTTSEFVVMERYGEGVDCSYKIINDIDDLNELNHLNSDEKRSFASSFIKWPNEWIQDFTDDFEFSNKKKKKV